MTLPDRQRWQQLSPLLDELLDLEADQRQHRLAQLRALDASMADELDTLLNASSRAEQASFLAIAAHADDAAPGALVGEQIGAYIIEAALGQGGTGSVWRARRADGRFEGAVAIKLLHLSLMGRMGAVRFEHEGAILARLTHPNIARLLDAGVTTAGQPYLVLELVDGERIDHHCSLRRLSVEQRLALFDDVLAAVAHAHSHLVIHRDIKPTNILVTAGGGVKLLDFGIAKLLQDQPEASPVTAEGQRALTPEYAAPEQLQGTPVTTATDVYSLGVLLYQLLTGRHPTANDVTLPAEVMRATLDTDPLRMATALTLPRSDDAPAMAQVALDRNTTLPRLRRQLQGDLENIVMRTLRKIPSERYQTVAALAEDLRRYRANEPVSARADSLAYRCAKFVRRRRGLVAAAAIVMLAVTAGLIGTITQAQRAQASALRAQQERDHALRSLAYAQSSSEFINFLLEEGYDKPLTTAELLARAEPMLEKQFVDDPAQRAHLELIVGNLFAQANYRAKGQALLLRARSDARDAPDISLKAEIECQIASEHGHAGEEELARPLFDSAIASLRTAPDADQGTLAQCLQSRSEVANLRGDAKAGLTDAQAAMELLRTYARAPRTQLIVTRATLADSLAKLGRSADSVQEYRLAISELEAMGRGQTRQAIGLYNNVGVALSRAGQTLGAVDAYRHAFEIGRGFGGAEPALEGNYANRLIEMGRSPEAIPLIEHALAESKARGDKRTGATVMAQGARAWCFTNALARCEELLSMARSELTAILPPGHSTFGTLETTQAQLALAHLDLQRARAGLVRAVAIFDAAADRNRIGIRALTLLARTELQLGELDAAEAHAGRAVTQAREAKAGFNHSEWMGSALVAQGMVQRARGDGAAAQASWRAALTELQASVGDSAPATLEIRQLLGMPK